jgi:hypothetical protein
VVPSNVQLNARARMMTNEQEMVLPATLVMKLNLMRKMNEQLQEAHQALVTPSIHASKQVSGIFYCQIGCQGCEGSRT